MAHRYPAPKIPGYRLIWQDSYTSATEEQSLDKLVTVDMAARAKGFDVRTVGIPGHQQP